MNNNKSKPMLFLISIVFIVIVCISIIGKSAVNIYDNIITNNSFKILMSTENKEIEPILTSYANDNNIKIKIDYAGTIEIMDKINNNEDYDAIWASNSIWLYMLENSYKITNSKSTSINPVVFGIKKSIAKNLGFIDNKIYTKDILNAINDKKLKFIMTSATQTNTGASAYLGFLSTLSGNPEVLTNEHLENKQLINDISSLLSGVTRTSGSDEFLNEVMLNGSYDAAISYESSLINLNKQLVSENKEPYYLIYPIDGVTISDSPLAYVDNGNEDKKEIFLNLQNYILSKEGQKKLEEYGRRTWYGGTNSNVNEDIFNKDWGIDTTRYLMPVKYPSSKIIKESLILYQTEFRKPTHTVFCLDYSGSMYGDGNEQLTNAMEYILDNEKASKNLLQFSSKDKIDIVTFNHNVLNIYSTNEGTETKNLITKIKNENIDGGTDLYDPLIKALDILSVDNPDEYNLSVIIMTDGQGNNGTFSDFKSKYNLAPNKIPIYAIMFGDAIQSQLKEITDLSEGKVFDGRSDLLKAFKEVRGYN